LSKDHQVTKVQWRNKSAEILLFDSKGAKENRTSSDNKADNPEEIDESHKKCVSMESQDIYSRLCWNFNRLHPHVSETTKFETLGFPYTYWGTEKLLPLDK
jgi:hypothetical protein